MSIDFDGQIAIITGAGGGLGRAHAVELARRNAHVIVNDVPGGSAEQAADEIRAAGNSAQAIEADITDADAVSKMAGNVLDQHKRVDILVNNAGILRDKSFANMSLEEWRAVMEVHLFGAVHLTHALWPSMKQQKYGRILFTSSPSGLYGNFGQANYAAAKMALVGLVNTLAIEGAKYNVRVNALAPLAATQMTADLLPENIRERFTPQAVSAGVAALTSSGAPSGAILSAAGGGFALAKMLESGGIQLDSPSAEDILDRWDEIADMNSAAGFASLPEHLEHVIERMEAP